VAGCGPSPRLELPEDVAEPYVTEVRHGLVWIRPDSAHDTERLERWRGAVGTPVEREADDPEDEDGVDSLVVVTWNVEVGGGDVEKLITDLRGGELTSRPERHFVLLLQEALRVGDAVPAFDPARMESAKPIEVRPPSGPRRGIDEVARRADLSLLYVPSMRNGNEAVPAEDRGNAILSTLRLDEPVVVELPVERQRRVAISAVIEGETSADFDWELRIVSLHLANRTGLSRFLDTFGRARLRQAGFLTLVLDRHDDERPAVIGADLNTWLNEGEEPVVAHLRERYPQPADPPEGGTYDASRWPDPQLDYLMFSLPESWRASYRRLDDTYGSDHYPLLGWIVFGGDEGNE
jgi:endonuclease/exonuclease/phosphatase family metal-dependent hydrolase